MSITTIVRTALFSGAFALAVSPFGSLAITNAQFDQNWFDWCRNHLDEGADYCCEHSGGVMRNDACIDPDDLTAPSSGTFQQDNPTTPPKRPPFTTMPTGVFAPTSLSSR